MKSRDISIDMLRGIVVSLMVASHTVWFLSDDTNVFWNFMRSWGDSVCFITFLFLFGISMYFSLLSKDFTDKIQRKRALQRVFYLLGAYYLIAGFGLISKFGDGDLIVTVLKTVFLIHVPGFTEFMIPFVVYTFGAYITKLFFLKRKITFPNLRLKYILIFSWGIYLIAMMINAMTHRLHLPEILGAFSAHFFNHDGFLRFGLLHYMPVLLLGIYFGQEIKREQEANTIQRQLIKISGVYALGALLLWISELFFNHKAINLFFRWPPSLLFMLFGMSFALFGLYLSRLIKPNEIRISEAVAFLGKHSIGILVFHIMIIRILEVIGVERSGNFIYLSVYFIILLFGFVCLRQLSFRYIGRRKDRNAV